MRYTAGRHGFITGDEVKIKEGDICRLEVDDLRITATVTSTTAEKIHLRDQKTGNRFSMLRPQFMRALQELKRRQTVTRVLRRV